MVTRQSSTSAPCATPGSATSATPIRSDRFCKSIDTKKSSYPIIGLLRHQHALGELTGPPAVLMADQRPAEELYDLEADPYEIHNLADDPAYAETKQRLAAALTRWQDEIDDKGRIPEDPAIAAKWEAEMKRVYDKKNESRSDDWFLSHPGAGAVSSQGRTDRLIDQCRLSPGEDDHRTEIARAILSWKPFRLER